ncbi:TIGR00725 family protein [Microbulbifer bruguierae]|uniref:TIGR00725 family protein n=1 Tax=Microbulbifer bruguierae TaxID=3029061 RepID=A0ABY8N8T8_9GAMM|nr:TIGR00725 family protein [Microbulbifer bruguierae]WGL15208.1 TIGR00725 family protein [Microbulbifer bruguierae]
MSRNQRMQIAVVGSASNQLSEVQRMLAFDVGKLLIDSGYRLISGGMGGVMEQAARGARSSARHQPGDVIGVLPSYNKAEANPYIDIALPTGLGVARNAVLMAACDGVIALDGGSGTLSEIALAWQMRKPIACVGGEGWHTRLQTLALDERREEAIALCPDMDALSRFLRHLHGRNLPAYRGIAASAVKQAEQRDYLQATFADARNIGAPELLGYGSEGTVFRCGQRICKIFHPTDFTILLFTHLSGIAQTLVQSQATVAPVPLFEVHLGDYLVVHYPDFASHAYTGGQRQPMVAFLRAMRAAGCCLSNVKAENFRCTDDNRLVCIDIGRDLMPYSHALFLSMCKRAFLTVYYSAHADFKRMCRYTNDHDDFDGIAACEGVAHSASELASRFDQFYAEVTRADAVPG